MEIIGSRISKVWEWTGVSGVEEGVNLTITAAAPYSHQHGIKISGIYRSPVTVSVVSWSLPLVRNFSCDTVLRVMSNIRSMLYVDGAAST